MAIGAYIFIITLNVKGLNAQPKRHRLAEWIQKTRSIYMLSSRDPLHFQGHIQIESERMEENILCKWGSKEKKAGVVILISGKIDFKMKNILRDREGHYIMIKGLIHEEDITIVHPYAPNIGSPQYIRQLLTP